MKEMQKIFLIRTKVGNGNCTQRRRTNQFLMLSKVGNEICFTSFILTASATLSHAPNRTPCHKMKLLTYQSK